MAITSLYSGYPLSRLYRLPYTYVCPESYI